MKLRYILPALLVIAVVGGFVAVEVVGRKTAPQVESISVDETAKVEVAPEFIDMGKVPMKGGIVTREYEVKNGASKSILVKKIVTSCMCTKAAVQIGDKSTRFFGMEMAGDKNPRLDFEIPAGTTAKLVVRYDPAAHGIQGKGPFDRTVELTFADPVGIKRVRFSGEVVIE